MKLLVMDNYTDRTGRKYNEQEVRKEVIKLNYQSFGGRLYGELSGPNNPVNMGIDLSQVSHSIRSVYVKGHSVYVEIDLLPTPAGKILEALISSGVNIEGTFRSSGIVDENSNVTELVIHTIDIREHV